MRKDQPRPSRNAKLFPTTDHGILRGMLDGRDADWDTFSDLYTGVIIMLWRRLYPGIPVCEKTMVVNNVLLAVYATLRSYDFDRPFRRWMSQLIRNTLSAHYRYLVATRRHIAEGTDVESLLAEVPHEPTADEFERTSEKLLVCAALKRAKDHCEKNNMILHFYDFIQVHVRGRKPADVAKEHSCEASGVSNRVSTVKKLIKRIFHEYDLQ